MKIYTRTGDEGKTMIIGGKADKDDIRIEAYGTVDELNSLLGQSISLMDVSKYKDLRLDLLEVQHELFDCGNDLAFSRPKADAYKVTQAMVDRLEKWIDKYDAETPDITKFILPGGSLLSSSLHVCRTVCRRAERRVVTLAKTHEINESVRKYLNRLSDLFFTVARVTNVREGVADIDYARSADVFHTPKKD